MGRWAVLVAIVLVTAGMAGCVGGGDVEDSGSATSPQSTNDSFSQETNKTDPETEVEDPGLQVDHTWRNATISGYDLPVLGWFCNPCDENIFNFEVTNDTTGFLVEAVWNTSGTMDLDLDVPASECEVGLTEDCPPEMETGESPLEHRITSSSDILAGEWEVEVWPEDAIEEEATVTVVVSVFENNTMPSGYTKVS